MATRLAVSAHVVDPPEQELAEWKRAFVSFERVSIPAPSLDVDTTDGYAPDLPDRRARQPLEAGYGGVGTGGTGGIGGVGGVGVGETPSGAGTTCSCLPVRSTSASGGMTGAGSGISAG